MKLIAVLFFSLIYLTGNSIQAQNAPISTAGTVVSSLSLITVSITATNITNIGSCNLKLTYDPAIIIATAVTKGPLLTGSLDSNLDVPGVISLGWYKWPGVTLADNNTVFNITFSKVATGSTAITWVDDGNSCVWSNGNWVVLNDQPNSAYYINGSVSTSSANCGLYAKDFLQGPYNTVTHAMNTDLT